VIAQPGYTWHAEVVTTADAASLNNLIYGCAAAIAYALPSCPCLTRSGCCLLGAFKLSGCKTGPCLSCSQTQQGASCTAPAAAVLLLTCCAGHGLPVNRGCVLCWGEPVVDPVGRVVQAVCGHVSPLALHLTAGALRDQLWTQHDTTRHSTALFTAQHTVCDGINSLVNTKLWIMPFTGSATSFKIHHHGSC